MSIPKQIHYCWFGKGKKPELALKCIESWKKYLPEYEIFEWNENNFDINSNLYVKQAYQSKKYAFVTDYVRLYVLYKFGGIYMDTDVEVLKPLDKFLDNHAFSGFENNTKVPTGIIGAVKGNEWIYVLLNEYNYLNFIKEDGTYDLTTNVERITNKTVKEYGLIQNCKFQNLGNTVTFYPFDYFCPKDWETGNIILTDNTCTIHHFSGSWKSIPEQKWHERKQKYIKQFGIEKGKKLFRFDSIVRFYCANPNKIVKKIVNLVFPKHSTH